MCHVVMSRLPVSLFRLSFRRVCVTNYRFLQWKKQADGNEWLFIIYYLWCFIYYGLFNSDILTRTAHIPHIINAEYLIYIVIIRMQTAMGCDHMSWNHGLKTMRRCKFEWCETYRRAAPWHSPKAPDATTPVIKEVIVLRTMPDPGLLVWYPVCPVGAAVWYPVCPDGSNIGNIIDYQELITTCPDINYHRTHGRTGWPPQDTQGTTQQP